MAIGDSSQTRLAYIAETVVGTTPTTPVFKTLRFTEEDISPDKQTIVSDEIRSDRNVSDIISVGVTSKGSISGELSHATYDDFLEALLCGAWTTNVLKNGVAPKSFTIEKTIELGATDSFLRSRGVFIDSAELDISSKQIVKAKFGVIGMNFDAPATAIIAGATYTAANTEPVMNAASNVGALTMTGITATPKVKSAKITIKNNMRGQDAIGSTGFVGIGLGRFEVTGKLTCYFENADLLAAAINHSDLTLSMTIGVDANKKYTISLPKIKLLDPSTPTAGNNQDVMVEVDFQAVYFAADAASMKITRLVA